MKNGLIAYFIGNPVAAKLLMLFLILGGVLAGLSPNQDRWVASRNSVERLSQQGERQLAGRKAHRFDAVRCFT